MQDPNCGNANNINVVVHQCSGTARADVTTEIQKPVPSEVLGNTYIETQDNPKSSHGSKVTNKSEEMHSLEPAVLSRPADQFIFANLYSSPSDDQNRQLN